jgi:Raf kinase inhibitor-like YbhB/YbcL family protein
LMRREWVVLTVLVLLLLLLCSCRSEKGSGPAAGGNVGPSPEVKGRAGAIKLRSGAFGDGGMIPAKYSCDGANVSPPLSWEGVPEGAKSLALVSEDPDAPNGVWVHWVVFNLPVGAGGLPEGVKASSEMAEGGLQGMNDFRKAGYGGPCPPSGVHRYFFRLYALDQLLPLGAGATKEQLMKAMEGHVLAQGELMGKYGR